MVQVKPQLPLNPNLSLSDTYQPHSNQLLIHEADQKYRVVVAGRRFGKSALALNEALAWLLDESRPRQMIWIILPQYKQARDIYWIDPDIVRYYMPYVQSGLFKKNDSDLSLFCYKTGSWLFLKGSNEADSLRGSGLDLIIWDEVADVKPDAFDVISPTLADSPNHRVMYMGTPDGYNHFHDLSLRGDHTGIIEKAGKNVTPDNDFITFKFTSYDNMAFAEGTSQRRSFINYLDKERQKYREMGQEDWFEQEYMAEFRKRAGAVHKLFDRKIHLIPDMQLPLEWKRIRGWDWGSSHPTASIRFVIDPDDNWYVEMCYKQKDEYIENHANNIKAQDAAWLTIDNTDPIQGFGDPSGAQWIKEFNKLGFSIKAAKKMQHTEKKTWLELAIDKINSKIAPKAGHTVFLPNGEKRENAPSFFILTRAENFDLVDELETLVYKRTDAGLTKTDIDDTTDPRGHYDLHASFRYFAVSEGAQTYFTQVDIPSINNREDLVKSQIPISVDMRDAEKRKSLEHDADMAIIAQQNQMRQQSGW